MKKITLIVLLSILSLIVLIPATSAMDNQTVIKATNESSLSVEEYYFDANVENDTGDGSIDNPYRDLTADRIKDNSIIHLADGEYDLDRNKSTDNVNIVGQHANATIIKFGKGNSFTVKNTLNIQNVTLVGLPIRDNSNTIINANNVIFKDSKASAIVSNSASTRININDCIFINNTASVGGAIQIKNAVLNIYDTLFINNYANLYGGAIASDSKANITIKRSKFLNDSSVGDGGGAIYIRDSLKFLCEDTEFVNCSATFGGAVTLLKVNSTFYNVTARNNRAKYDGGAIYSMYRLMSLYDSRFDNNTAKNAGAVYADEIEIFNIYNNVFSNNHASHTAGAVYSLLSDTFYDSIYDDALNNTFINNTAAYEDDVYETDNVNLTVGSGDCILIRYNSTFNGTIPSRYDLRELNQTTPVKDQGGNGNCWAFSILASLESCILKATGNVYDLSEANMKNLMGWYSDYGWNMETNTGGYDKMGYGYLAGWLGPVNESDDPYTIGTVLSPVLNSMFHVQNILFLNRKDYTDNDEIKKAIIEYGAVSTSVYFNPSSSSYAKGNSYYYTGSEGANHAVAIVGWDDSYSKDNFKTVPPGDGAWIIKNSWGTSRDKGYYYVSYYDKVLARPGKTDNNIVFLFNDSIKYDKNYQYDIPGKTDYFLNTTSKVWYKNSFIATDNEYLSAVSTYFSKQTYWDVSIYVNGVLEHTQSGKSPNSYSTIELTQFIPLNVGDIFEIVFKIAVDGHAGVPISEFFSLNKELYHENISFISYDGENWEDLYDLEWKYPDHTYDSQVACIKAFTILNPVNTFINLTVENQDNPCIIRAFVFNEYGNPVLCGNVTFNIEGKDYIADIVNGAASICHVFSNFTNNHVSASFDKTGFNGSSADINVTVRKGNVTIGLEVTVDILDVRFDVRLSSPIDEIVRLLINGTVYGVNVTGGTGSLFLSHMFYGQYNVTAYIDTDRYYCENVTKSFRISYIETFIEAQDIECYCTSDFAYSIRLVDRNGTPISNKNVRFAIGNIIKDAATDSNGIASARFSLNVGSYQVIITCPNEYPYLPSEDSKRITIKSTIDLPSYSKYAYNSDYVVHLIDSNGNGLNNVRIMISVGTKEYALTTDSYGKLSFNVVLSPGTYLISIKNSATGEVKVQDITVVKRITENKALTMYYGAGSSYNLRVYDDNGNVAKNVRVKFTINGKTYYRYTNSNGYAYLKISLKPAKYTVTAEYKGYKVSNKITVKTTLITKNRIFKKGKTIKFTAKLLNSKGKILKNKKVTFKFKGKTYKVKTNRKGIATLKITRKYKVGKYTITSKYGKLSVKNTIRIKK